MCISDINRVIFEIVESEVIQDFDKMYRFINEIKRYGAKIAIDDFGDGYSNFSYLIKMNVDFLKIDGSLIENVDINKNSYLVVETIVDFAHKLGIKTIAEFVHSSTVLDKVQEMGIDFSQGYYIDKPSLELQTESSR
jgi:EAL domain-containing protein (putative c-di-GMP-specific phosphodiesterase class I)